MNKKTTRSILLNWNIGSDSFRLIRASGSYILEVRTEDSMGDTKWDEVETFRSEHHSDQGGPQFIVATGLEGVLSDKALFKSEMEGTAKRLSAEVSRSMQLSGALHEALDIAENSNIEVNYDGREIVLCHEKAKRIKHLRNLAGVRLPWINTPDLSVES